MVIYGGSVNVYLAPFEENLVVENGELTVNSETKEYSVKCLFVSFCGKYV